jgi:hypothetical protein
VSELVWCKSSYSHTNGCVEVAFVPGGEWVLVRNSRTPLGATQTYTRREFSAFVEGARAGEFDGEREGGS